MTTREQTQLKILEIAICVGHYSPRTYSQVLAVGFLEGKKQLRKIEYNGYRYWIVTQEGVDRYAKDARKQL